MVAQQVMAEPEAATAAPVLAASVEDRSVLREGLPEGKGAFPEDHRLVRLLVQHPAWAPLPEQVLAQGPAVSPYQAWAPGLVQAALA